MQCLKQLFFSVHPQSGPLFSYSLLDLLQLPLQALMQRDKMRIVKSSHSLPSLTFGAFTPSSSFFQNKGVRFSASHILCISLVNQSKCDNCSSMDEEVRKHSKQKHDSGKPSLTCARIQKQATPSTDYSVSTPKVSLKRTLRIRHCVLTSKGFHVEMSHFPSASFFPSLTLPTLSLTRTVEAKVQGIPKEENSQQVKYCYANQSTLILHKCFIQFKGLAKLACSSKALFFQNFPALFR